MSVSRRRFTQEFKDELCREVISTSKPIRDVAVAYGVGPETLRNWVNKYREANGGTDTELTGSERARLKQLEREVQELRAETAFLNYSDVRIMPMFA
jgi:transposase